MSRYKYELSSQTKQKSHSPQPSTRLWKNCIIFSELLCLLRQHFKWPWIFADGEKLKKHVSFQSWAIRGKLFTVTQVRSDSLLKGWVGINTKPLADKDSSIHTQVPVNPRSLLSLKCPFPWLIHPGALHTAAVLGSRWKSMGSKTSANAFSLSPSALSLKSLPLEGCSHHGWWDAVSKIAWY